MSKTKTSDKTHYEMLFIIPNKFTEDEAKAIEERIGKAIAAANGEITYSEDWGKKKMAYAIGGYNYGYYKLAEFDLPGAELKALDNSLRLSSDILRHQIVKIKKRTPEQIAADKKTSEELAKKRRGQDEEAAAKPVAAEAVEEKTSTLATEEKPAEERKTAKKKTDLKDLDKKLDDILDTNDLL